MVGLDKDLYHWDKEDSVRGMERKRDEKRYPDERQSRSVWMQTYLCTRHPDPVTLPKFTILFTATVLLAPTVGSRATVMDLEDGSGMASMQDEDLSSDPQRSRKANHNRAQSAIPSLLHQEGGKGWKIPDAGGPVSLVYAATNKRPCLSRVS